MCSKDVNDNSSHVRYHNKICILHNTRNTQTYGGINDVALKNDAIVFVYSHVYVIPSIIQNTK